MSLALDRPEFAPPPQRGTGRALVLALIAHGLLIAALTWGVRWRSDADEGAVDAELWSSTVQQAAPRLQAPPAPAPVPAPPPPAPAPPPPPAAKAPEPAPTPKAPDIALEREKKLKEQKEQQERELERQQQQKKKELEAKQRAEDEAQRKKEQQQKLAEQKKQQEAEAKQAEQKKAETAAKQAAADRAAALKRMQTLAGTGASDATGSAERSSGPKAGKGSGSNGNSAAYAARVQAAIRPHVNKQGIEGDPKTEVEVRLAPDGTVVGTPRVTKSSGSSIWDDRAVNGVLNTAKLPRNDEGTVPSVMLITISP